jgi:hypothetical protein
MSSKFDYQIQNLSLNSRKPRICDSIDHSSDRGLGRPILIKSDILIFLLDIHPLSLNKCIDINYFHRYTYRPVPRTWF